MTLESESRHATLYRQFLAFGIAGLGRGRLRLQDRHPRVYSQHPRGGQYLQAPCHHYYNLGIASACDHPGLSGSLKQYIDLTTRTVTGPEPMATPGSLTRRLADSTRTSGLVGFYGVYRGLRFRAFSFEQQHISTACCRFGYSLEP